MEGLVKGDVVVIPFPFTDLRGSTKRPGVVVAKLQGDDLILCQITSQERDDPHAISLDKKNFASGNLPVNSFIRPSRLFTAENKIVLNKKGHVKSDVIKKIEEKIVGIVRG